MKPNTTGKSAILKAVDEEHVEIVRAAQAIYDERMKPVRKKRADARMTWERAKAAAAAAEIAWEKAQATAIEAERRHDQERVTNVGEANRRRDQLRRAVIGARPVTVAAIKEMARGRKAGSAEVRATHGERDALRDGRQAGMA